MRDMYHCFGKTYMANPYKKTIGELFHLTLNCHSILASKGYHNNERDRKVLLRGSELV